MFEMPNAIADAVVPPPPAGWDAALSSAAPMATAEIPVLPTAGRALALVITGRPAGGVAGLAERVRVLGGLVVWLRSPAAETAPSLPLGRRLRPLPAMRPGDAHITAPLAQAFDETRCDLADRLSLWGLDTVWITGGDPGLAAGPAARQARAIGFRPTLLLAEAERCRPGLAPVRTALAADGIPTPTVAQARAALDAAPAPAPVKITAPPGPASAGPATVGRA